MSLKFCCLCQGCLQLMISALSSVAVGQQCPTTISSPLVQTRMHVWIFTDTHSDIHTCGVVQLKIPFTQKWKFCLSKSLTLVHPWNTNKDICNILSSSNPSNPNFAHDKSNPEAQTSLVLKHQASLSFCVYHIWCALCVLINQCLYMNET